MKLQATLYSQRDNRWANILLGYNKNQPYTIGNYGCLITSFGAYINKTPIEINDILKANNGFDTNSGNFLWGKSNVLGLNQTYVSPKYYDAVPNDALQKIKNLLDQGLPLICEVDFNPNTTYEEMHFVLIIGYEGDSFYAVDPWVGEIINLSVYGGAPRAIIQFRAYDKKLQVPAPVTQPSNYSTDQAIRDGYKALCGVYPSEDEVNYRKQQLSQGKNMVDILTEICAGDGRFKALWIPDNAQLKQDLDAALDRINKAKDYIKNL